MIFRPLALAAVLLAVPMTAPAPAQGLSGPYLASRIAGFSNDYAAAAKYYDTLLARGEDDPRVLENAIVIYAALGDLDRAVNAADRLEAGGGESQFADGARLVRALRDGEYDRAITLIDERGEEGALLDGLLRGWIDVAQGDTDGALARFRTLAETDGFERIAQMHEAFVLAMTGDYEGADEILSGRAYGPLGASTRGIDAHVQVLMQLGREDAARELLNQANAAANSPVLQALSDRLDSDEEIAWDFIADASAGMAEAYFTLAAIFANEASPVFTLLSARAAIALRPDHLDALVLTAELLEQQGQYELASDVLDDVPRDHPSFFGAEITRAEVLAASGKDEAAVEVLSALTKAEPDRLPVWSAYGDILRRLERFEESAAAYDRAIDLIEGESERDWYLHYVRGIALERQGDARWDEAEAAFRRALELNPTQPLVLNYLGYGLVERQEKLDEALDMIERAVAARPDDGYITDSLGWVYYRLGRFEEAVGPMERAADLEPLDPIVNDHLGDVLWAVGREREARFQWRRALSFDPEEDEAERIRRKLEIGLDAVLEEEGADPIIPVAQD